MLATAVVALTVAAGVLAGCGGDDDGATSPTVTSAPSTTAEPTPDTTLPGTSTTAPPTTAPTTTVPTSTSTTAPAPVGLRPGAEGAEVLSLQQALGAIGFWLGEPDSNYGSLTQQAVLAFQKANGLARDGIAGPATLAALGTASRPAPRVITDGIEIDLDRQIILVVQGGQATIVLNTSTGTAGWRTPPGDFRIERQIDGMRQAPLGDLWRPKYFHGGIAIHGSTSIPAYPASHGCTRVSFAAMDMLWASGLAEVGTRVVVY